MLLAIGEEQLIEWVAFQNIVAEERRREELEREANSKLGRYTRRGR